MLGLLIVALLVTGAVVARAYFNRQTGGEELAQIKAEALAFYQAQYPELTGLSAELVNYGCHFEIEIRQAGKTIARLGWNGPGQFYEVEY